MVGVDVAVVVMVLVPVVEAVIVALEVTDVVCEEVGVLETEVVPDVVRLVVGVVTSQDWNPPSRYASAIAFREAAVSSQAFD